MPNISSLTMPDGIVYSIKDSQARKDIEEIKKNGSAGSGGAGAIYATFTKSGGTWSCNKTVAELKAAYEAGKSLIANIDHAWIVPIIMIDAGIIQFFEATGVTVNGIPPQFDDIRIDTVKLDYFSQDGTDAVEATLNTWQVSATAISPNT